MKMRAAPRSWWMRLQNLVDLTPSSELERVSSTRLTPRHSLHVVVWEGRRLLVGCSDQAIQLLAESPGGASGGSSSASPTPTPCLSVAPAAAEARP